MNLQEVLERNKNKALKTQYKIRTVSIATEDRPYDSVKKSPHYSNIKQNIGVFSTNTLNNHTNNGLTSAKTNDITIDELQTKHIQNDDKVMTNWEHDNVETSDINIKQATNWRQTSPVSNDKVMTELWQNKKVPFSSLAGLQRYITIHIYTLCKVSRDKKTKEISISQLSYCCKSTVKSVKKSIFRLIEKGIIFRDSFKNGRGGWTVYYLPDAIYQEIMNAENNNGLATNWRQSNDKAAPELMTSTHSSGSYIYKTTTTDDLRILKQQQLSIEWQSLDIAPLNQIGFNANHLSQIAAQNKLSPQVVQDSIYAFAFDLQENNKAKSIKGDPINFFMGILRKVGPYVTPSNYESPQDKAMRIYRENMLEIERRRVDAEKEATNLAFNDWFSKLTDKQKTEFLPEMLRHNANSEKLGKSKILESSARSYFEKEIWPEIKEKILGK